MTKRKNRRRVASLDAQRAKLAARKELFDILSISRPHGSTAEVLFCQDVLDAVPGMQQDGFGNRYVRIGDAPVLWSCHVDTVAHQSMAGFQPVTFDPDTGFVQLTDSTTPKRSLGADDGAGLWLMLQMIKAGRPGLYIFHRGEEVGCLGSRYIREERKDLLVGILWAIAFDRQGTDSIITWQSSGKTASDAFAYSLARHLNKAVSTFSFKPDDTGIYTDTNEYADVIPECSNISVGYYGQHSCREELDVYHLENLLSAMLTLDVADLKVDREAGDSGFSRFADDDDGWHRAWQVPQRDNAGDWLESLIEAVRDNPRGAAWLLYEAGRDAFDVLEAEDEWGPFINAGMPDAEEDADAPLN